MCVLVCVGSLACTRCLCLCVRAPLWAVLVSDVHDYFAFACMCVCVCRLSVCSSHAVAVVVVAPLLAMTGDVDAMCTIHFGVSFVRSYLSVSVSFFFVSFAAVAILFLRLLSVSACCFSLLYYAFYLLFDCDCLSVSVFACACV